jgi:hypothetical protein
MTELILTIAAIYVLRLTIARDVRRGTWCLLLCLLALTATRAEAQVTYTATASGNWSDAATWSGSTFSFAGSAFTGIVSANYSSSAAAIDTIGAENSDPGTWHVPGIPDETLTITCLGAPQCAAKATGATAMSWNDGGSVGTSSGSYTAECVSTHPGGSLDGQATTEHVFKMRRTGSGTS